jgi:hypothetical protein
MNGSWGFGAWLLVGVAWQYLIKWTPGQNWVLSFLLACLLPPGLTGGLLAGIWICSAFIVSPVNLQRKVDRHPKASWKEIVKFSLWTFAGFLLTLVFMFKIKLTGVWEIKQCQWFAWSFLVVLELCLLRIIARLTPSYLRLGVGFRMGFLNFLMLLYWLYPYGWILGGLTLLTLLVMFPLLLSGMAFSKSKVGIIKKGRN